MKRIASSLTLLTLTTLLIWPTAALAQTAEPTPSETSSAGTNGGDTAVVAINTRDDANIFRFAFMVKRTMQDVVDNDNAAVAVSSCTECQTVAASFQVVLILSDPSIVTTDNLAIAMNVDCSLCATLASAYQFVMTTGGQVRFTAEGNRELAAIRRALEALRQSDLSILEIQAKLDELRDRVANVLATQLVLVTPTNKPTASPSGIPMTPTPTEISLTPSETPSPTDAPSETVSEGPTPSVTASP
jgi:putative peptide zinc metalloprotease protein